MQVLAASEDLKSVSVILCVQIQTDPGSNSLGKKNKTKQTTPEPTLESQILCRLGAKTLLKLISISGRL